MGWQTMVAHSVQRTEITQGDRFVVMNLALDICDYPPIAWEQFTNCGIESRPLAETAPPLFQNERIFTMARLLR